MNRDTAEMTWAKFVLYYMPFLAFFSFIMIIREHALIPPSCKYEIKRAIS